MKTIFLALILTVNLIGAPRVEYPKHWWAYVDKKTAPSWEILPQEAGEGEVILSKRNELGILSNFTEAPFEYRGMKYRSVEGLWQMMLYPEGPNDPRALFPGLQWKYTREQVSQMVAFEAKGAGDLAKKNMETMNINWVSFEGKHFDYWTSEKGAHYRIIREVMEEKFKQNAKVREVLMMTKGLVLRPDHYQEKDAPPAWRYYQIWMELRDGVIPPALDR